jgi:hypothetical protein
MKIKVIDLYYKTIKNEEVPKVIKYDNTIWEYDKDNNDYYSDEWLFSGYLGNSTLNEFYNDEAKIIEEEKKIELPEKLEIEQDTPNSNYYIKNEFGTKCVLTKHSKMIADKLNEILDYLKYKEEESKK